MFLLLQLVAAPPAHAGDVLFHNPDPYNTYTYYTYTSGFSTRIHPDIEQALLDAGSTGVDHVTELPGDLSPYKVVILIPTTLDPAPTYNAAQLQFFLDQGGWLIINGDNELFTAHNESFNTLLSDLGRTMRIEPTTPNNNCQIFARLADPYHALMQGVVDLAYASQAKVVPGSGHVLVQSLAGEGLVVVDGNLVVTGDSTIFSDTCELSIGNVNLTRNIYEAAGTCPDLDNDGYQATSCGGLDCDDGDPEISPDAVETWYDGVDQDCSGGSDYDRDGDGHDSDLHGGDDCDDADPDTYPGALEQFYDGIDQDCAGDSDFDRDGDGYLGGEDGNDCDDINRTINPAAFDIPDDGIDQNCDGIDGEGGGDGPDAAAGCGCTSTPSPLGGLPGLALIGLVGLRRRRASRTV